MKKILVLAALVAAMFTPSLASAQVATADLNWRRVENRGGTTVYTSYDIANGFRDFTNTAHPGVSASADTTAPIPLWNHYYKNNNHGTPVYPGGSGGLGDSVFVGTLVLESTASFIDSLVIYRQVSADGFSWTLADSLNMSTNIGSGTDWASAVPQDYSRVIGASTDIPSVKRVSLLWYARPWENSRANTRLAFRDVNFVRYYITMTNSDYYAAGSTSGVRGRFIYPTR